MKRERGGTRGKREGEWDERAAASPRSDHAAHSCTLELKSRYKLRVSACWLGSLSPTGGEEGG